MYVNFQYITASCVSYPSSTKTLICGRLKPRLPCSVPVNTLVGTRVETCTGFVLSCETPDPVYTVETVGISVGGFWSADDEYAPDSDIICKINKCKQS